ncbi:hypothetical protein JCM15519_21250 [Fundidesulfovibrio butyratiphilus]
MTALLSGSYTPPARPSDPEYHSVMDPTPAKPKPWIGPDGGPIGRGIKAAGDWYMDSINKRRDGIISTMNAELKDMFRPQLIDGINTWAHGMLTLYTGIDTGFEPQFGLNKLIIPNALFNTGSGMFPGGQTRANPLVPLFVTGARLLGGEQLKPAEIWNTLKAATIGAAGFAKSPADQQAQRAVKGVSDRLNATQESFNFGKDQLENFSSQN